MGKHTSNGVKDLSDSLRVWFFMNTEVIRAVESVALVIVGWLLSILTIELKEFRIREREKRKLFTRLWLILENIYISLELTQTSHRLGDIGTPETSPEAAPDTAMSQSPMAREENDHTNIPQAPPSLPKDFDVVLEKVGEWESESGKNTFVKQLNSLRSQVELSHQFYHDLKAEVQTDHKSLAKRKLESYTNLLTDLKKDTFRTLKLTSPLRFPLSQKLKRGMNSGD